MKNTQKTLLIASLLTGTLAVYAQGGMSFSDFDADKNGLVSEQEFNAAKANRIAGKAKEGRQMRNMGNSLMFASFDTNRDGQLTEDEMQAMKQTMQQAMPQTMPQAKGKQGKSNGQGMRKGMGRPAKPVFADFDANNDNSLTEKEYYDARNKRIGDRAKEGRQMKGLANMASFADIDSNADGKVSQEEFAGFLQEHEKKGH